MKGDQGTGGAANVYVHTLARLVAPDALARARKLWPELVAALVGFAVGVAGLFLPRGVDIDKREPPVPTASLVHLVASRPPQVLSHAPPRPAVRLHVGDIREFVVAARGDDLQYRWTIDSELAGVGPRFVFAPAVGQIGRREVALTIDGPGGIARRRWTVRVRPPRPPSIVAASPQPDTLRVAAGDEVQLSIDARPATPREHLDFTWTVDGKPAGKSAGLTVRPRRVGTTIVQAVAMSDLGAAAARTWLITVHKPTRVAALHRTTRVAARPASRQDATLAARAPRTALPELLPATAPSFEAAPDSEPAARAPEPLPAEAPDMRAPDTEAPPRMANVLAVRPLDTAPPAPNALARGMLAEPSPSSEASAQSPAPSSGAAIPEESAILEKRSATVHERPASMPAAVSLPAAIASPPAGVGQIEEVEDLLERYAAAWRDHDVQTLRAMGQVTSEAQAKALGNYFATVRDLDVKVTILRISPSGTRTTVRFTRRDRFRDPIGREVSKESAIEKEIMRTPEGLKFARPPG